MLSYPLLYLRSQAAWQILTKSLGSAEPLLLTNLGFCQRKSLLTTPGVMANDGMLWHSSIDMEVAADLFHTSFEVKMQVEYHYDNYLMFTYRVCQPLKCELLFCTSNYSQEMQYDEMIAV